MSSTQPPTTAETFPVSDPPAVPDIQWKDGPRIVASGLCMGTADLVPGVSGGTVAVAVGIYRQLLAAIDSAPKAVRAALPPRRENLMQGVATLHWRFIACLGLGIAMALVVMGKVVGLPAMVTENPKPIYSIFFGLVIASCWLLAKRVKAWDGAGAASLFLGTVIGYVIVQLVPVQTPDSAPFLFLYGAVAITAMILPGISGAFILLVLGQYEHIVTSVLSFDLGVAIPFALGCLVGLTSFSKLLGWLLDHYHDPMTAGLTGLLLGSLVRIWPYQETVVEVIRDKPRVVSAVAFIPDQLEMTVVGLAIVGLVTVLGIEFLASRRGAVDGL